jgi:hypothetical protein
VTSTASPTNQKETDVPEYPEAMEDTRMATTARAAVQRAEVSSDDPGLGGQIARIDGLVQRLDATLDMLQDRLYPVLRDVDTVPGLTEQKREQPRSTHAINVASAADRLDGLIDRIDQMRNRIDV